MKRILILSALILASYHFQAIAAVHLSNDGTGQVAIVPFYSVVNGNETHLRVMNAGDQYKAVRVNVRTADISAQPVYSINVYLRPHDTWRMAMGQRDGFIAAINTDTTCTLGLTEPGDQAVDWSNHIWETGFIEVIEMGNISPETIGQYVDENEYCSLMEEAWAEGGAWSDNPLAGLNPTAGELQVTTELFNGAAGYSFNIPVTMLADFYPQGSIVHTTAGSSEPNLDSGSHNSQIIYQGETIKTTWEHGYQAVSALLMKKSVTNEYNLIKDVQGKTDWVTTFPTLSYHMTDPNVSDSFYYPNDRVDYAAYSKEGHATPYPCGAGHVCFGIHATKIDYLAQHTSVYNFKLYFDENRQSNLIHTDEENAYIFNVNSESWRFSDPQERLDAQSGKAYLNFTSNHPSGGNSPVYAEITGTNSDTGEYQTFKGLPMIGFAVHFTYNNAVPAVYSRSVNHTATRLITEESE